jgi:WD40 repeat protein
VTSRVFLAHAKEDKPVVKRLSERLKAIGISGWLDSNELTPAQDWAFEISRVLPTMPAVVVCLSSRSVTSKGSFRRKQGYFQKEIQLALEEARKKPPGTPFILPLRLDDCPIPENLRGWHWVDYFDSDGFKRLVQFMRRRFASITDSSSPIAISQQRKSSNPTGILGVHQERVYAVPFNRSGTLLASASYDRLVKLWNVTQRCEYVTFQGHKDMVFWVAFSPDGEWLATASRDRTAKMWHMESGQVITLRGHKHWVHSVEFSPDGRWLATGSDDGTVRLWDLKTRQSRRPFEGHTAPVRSVAFSPVGKNLASGGADSAIKLWKGYSNKRVRTFLGHSDCVTCVVFSPDGTQLASSSADRTALIWNVDKGVIHKTLKAKSEVNSVAFSPDGQFITGACFDGKVRIWNIATETTVRVLKGHEGRVFNATFSPNGHLLASAGEDRTIRLWTWRPRMKASGYSKLTLSS